MGAAVALVLLAAAVAQAATARPDISGVWRVAAGSDTLQPVGGGQPPLLPAARQAREEFQARLARGDRSGDPIEQCRPPGNPRTLLESRPFEIVQRPTEIFFGYEWNRLIRFVSWGDTLPPAPGWTYYGNSVASWDGNVLVIRSHGYQPAGVTLLDRTGLPQGEKLQLTERYALADDGRRLQLQLTIDDAEHYSRPWQARVWFDRQDNVRIGDDVCVLRQNLIDTRPRE